LKRGSDPKLRGSKIRGVDFTGSKLRMQIGTIKSINLSHKKGIAKKPVTEGLLIEDFGLEDDAHGGPGIAQVSLLALESIRQQKACLKNKEQLEHLAPGDFAENITTEGLDLTELKVGDIFKVGADSLLELSRIGKECHTGCAIYRESGDCIMPREGIFAKVIKGGRISVGDEVKTGIV